MADRYDVFLSFKNLDGKGKPTRDSFLAQQIFDHLHAKGLSVFFSNVALERAGEAAFKKAIDEALDRSETLVAVGTSKENLESEWVRYEWDGFFIDKLNRVKPDARMFTYVEGLDPRSLPRTLRQSQVIQHGERSLERLHSFIVNGLRLAEKKPASDLSARDIWAGALQHSVDKTTPRSSPIFGTGVLGVSAKAMSLSERLAEIEADASLTRDDKDFLKLMWEQAEIDQQREKLMNKLVVLDKERRPSDTKVREAVFQQLEMLNRLHKSKKAEANKLKEGARQNFKKLFK